MKSVNPIRPKDHVHDVVISDIAVGGDIHRIVLSGIRTSPGVSARDVRTRIMQEHDALRQILLSYPYGNPDMCADLVFESGNDRASHGYVVMECMGYPYFSGSNTMATISALVEYGLVPLAEGDSAVCVEAPSGPIDARIRVEDGHLEEVVVAGDRAYVIADGLSVDVPGFGTVAYATVWSGACFVMVDATALGLAVDDAHEARLKEAGLAIIEAVKDDFAHDHPEIGPIDKPGFVHFVEPLERTADRHYRSRGATYGHPATLFLCPTGTGTAARMALHVARGEMEPDAVIENTSAAGNMFIGRCLREEDQGGQRMLATTIAAKPYVLSTTTLHLDFSNPLMEPFAKLNALVGADSRDV